MHRLPTEALLDDLSTLTKELGRSSTKREIRDLGSYSYHQYWQRSGDLKVAAGADGRHEPHYSPNPLELNTLFTTAREYPVARL